MGYNKIHCIKSDIMPLINAYRVFVVKWFRGKRCYNAYIHTQSNDEQELFIFESHLYSIHVHAIIIKTLIKILNLLRIIYIGIIYQQYLQYKGNVLFK